MSKCYCNKCRLKKDEVYKTRFASFMNSANDGVYKSRNKRVYKSKQVFTEKMSEDRVVTMRIANGYFDRRFILKEGEWKFIDNVSQEDGGQPILYGYMYPDDKDNIWKIQFMRTELYKRYPNSTASHTNVSERYKVPNFSIIDNGWIVIGDPKPL